MNNFISLKEEITQAVEELNEQTVLLLSEKALAEGVEPVTLLEAVNAGMHKVGRLYENKTYFIADLIMAGIIFKEVLELERMKQHFYMNITKKVGRVVVGTVRGDLHDIGKDIFRGMMETNCFDVIDLGVDVSPGAFVKAVSEYRPEILGLAGVLTYTTDAMKDVVDALVESGLRNKVKVIIGGNHLTEESCRVIGADAYATDATIGARLCVNWINCEGRSQTIR